MTAMEDFIDGAIAKGGTAESEARSPTFAARLMIKLWFMIGMAIVIALWNISALTPIPMQILDAPFDNLEIINMTSAIPVRRGDDAPDNIVRSGSSEQTAEMVGGGPCHCNIGSSIPSLAFVHIRKTGGTAIETIAKEKGIIWGKNEWVGKNRTRYEKLDNESFSNATRWQRSGTNKFHIPPKYFHPYPYQNMSTFAIVRNPYERIISEYYQRRKKLMKLNPKNPTQPRRQKNGEVTNFTSHNVNDVQDMNDYVEMAMLRPGRDVGIPQHEYIYGADGKRIVTHVLGFDNLKREFDALMECYMINLVLPAKPINGRQSTADLTVHNLTNHSIALINEFMRKDFELFGYPVIRV